MQLTEFGEEVMHAREPLPASLQLAYPLARRLARIAATIEGGDVSGETGERQASVDADTDGDDPTRDERASSATSASGAAARPSAADEELRNRLKRWRGKTSAALGIPAYRVLSNATIERLVADKPGTTDQLEMIHGVGPATVEQFGYDLIRLINEANDEQPSPSPQPPPTIAATPAELPDRVTAALHAAPLAAAPPAADPLDAYWTWRMLRDGYTWDDVALIRRKDADAILQDLTVAAEAGHEVRPSWAATAEQRQRLEKLSGS